MNLVETKAASRFQWSISKRQYSYVSNGRAVSAAKLREWVDIAVERARLDLRAIGQALLDGTISKPEFALQAAEEIRNLHRSLSILAGGGKDQMGASEWGRLGSELKEELGYLARFSSAVDNVEVSTLGDAFLNRIESYGEAGRFTYQAAVRAREIDAGEMEEANELGGSANSCSECLDATALGFQPAGTLSEPGTRECGPGCQCEIIYRVASAANRESEEEAA